MSLLKPCTKNRMFLRCFRTACRIRWVTYRLTYTISGSSIPISSFMRSVMLLGKSVIFHVFWLERRLTSTIRSSLGPRRFVRLPNFSISFFCRTDCSIGDDKHG